MKKINKDALIITYYNSENYGAFLQAFALQEFLRNNDIESYVYKYDSKSARILSKIYKLLKRNRRLEEKQQEYNQKMGQKVLEEQSKLNLTNDNHKDVTILGSDEIWNAKNIGSPHDKFIFCKNKFSKLTISYAACSGNSKLKHLKIFPFAINGIKNLDKVSVRDEFTEELVKKIRTDEIYRVLDPTFLVDFNKYLDNKKEKYKYIFVYSYGLNEQNIKDIKKLAKDKKLKIVATGNYCDWADYNPVPTPFEWVNLIKNAEFVITSTFHGTVLSIELNKNFAVYNSTYPKIKNVLKEFKLVDRGINEWTSLDYLFENEIDYDKVNDIKEKLVNNSKEYLLSSFYDKKIIKNKNKIDAYIARHKDEKVRENSRSGGAFTAISDVVLKQNGVIYGAQLCDDMITRHVRATNSIERDKMRGSKYVQSDLSSSLELIKEDLLNDKIVLFTGTSCQTDSIIKLAEKLKKIDNLITMDFICHGVASPLIVSKYLNKYNNVKDFNYRDKKRFGWGAHKESILSDNKTIYSQDYSKLYYSDYIMRPSCYKCPYSDYKRYSDITIADAWNIENIKPNFNNDDMGASTIIVNTEVGKKILKEALKNMEYFTVKEKDIYQPVLKANGCGAINSPQDRNEFWKDFKNNDLNYVFNKYIKISKKDKIKFKIDCLIPRKFVYNIKKKLKKS